MPDSPENRLCRIQRAIELQAVEAMVNTFGSSFPVCETLLELETARIVSFHKGGYYSIHAL